MPKSAVFDEKKFQAEDDARTLQRAMEIVGDKGRLKAAKKEIDEQKKHLEMAQEKLASMGASRTGEALHESF